MTQVTKYTNKSFFLLWILVTSVWSLGAEESPEEDDQEAGGHEDGAAEERHGHQGRHPLSEHKLSRFWYLILFVKYSVFVKNRGQLWLELKNFLGPNFHLCGFLLICSMPLTVLWHPDTLSEAQSRCKQNFHLRDRFGMMRKGCTLSTFLV